MRTVTIGVATLEQTKQRLAMAFEGVPQEPRIDFVSFELMMKMLTPKRWELLQSMLGRGPLGVRELARLVDRDVSNVHADIEALATGGVLCRTDDGVEFPYDAVRLDVMLTAAA